MSAMTVHRALMKFPRCQHKASWKSHCPIIPFPRRWSVSFAWLALVKRHRRSGRMQAVDQVVSAAAMPAPYKWRLWSSWVQLGQCSLVSIPRRSN